MAAKRFGALMLEADISTILVTTQNNYDSTINVIFVNQSSSDAEVFLSYVDSNIIDDLSLEDYIVFAKNLEPNSTYEIKGIALEGGCSLVARSTIENVSVLAYGFEEEI